MSSIAEEGYLIARPRSHLTVMVRGCTFAGGIGESTVHMKSTERSRLLRQRVSGSHRTETAGDAGPCQPQLNGASRVIRHGGSEWNLLFLGAFWLARVERGMGFRPRTFSAPWHLLCNLGGPESSVRQGGRGHSV